MHTSRKATRHTTGFTCTQTGTLHRIKKRIHIHTGNFAQELLKDLSARSRVLNHGTQPRAWVTDEPGQRVAQAKSWSSSMCEQTRLC